jgi:hypothetical protein
MPDDFGHVAGDERAAADDDFRIGSGLGNQVPGVAQVALNVEDTWI